MSKRPQGKQLKRIPCCGATSRIGHKRKGEKKKKKKKGPINEQTSPSRFRSTDIKEDVGVGREGGDKERTTTTDSLLLLTPTHLLSHWPTQLSPHPGVRRGSANSFLVLFH